MTQLLSHAQDLAQVEKDRYSKVYLDTSSRGFQRLDTNCGTFWVMLENVEPYPDGYKLVLSIGNPYYAIFSGMKTLARWGPAFDGNVSEKDVSAYEAWEKTLKQKEGTVTHALRPGTWNKMTVILAPAKQEDLAYVEFSMTVEQVKLGDWKKLPPSLSKDTCRPGGQIESVQFILPRKNLAKII